MITPRRGLSDADLAAVADLEARVVAADGGRLKLEHDTLRGRSGEHVEDLLAWDGDRLVGFLGLYAFGPPDVELAGAVEPLSRRRGLGSALLDAALPLAADRGYARALLVTPRGSAGGAALAASRGAVLDHSEHALLLDGPPADGPGDPSLVLRDATGDDVPLVARLLDEGFGWAPPDLAARLHSPSSRTLVAEQGGRPVATVRRTLDGDRGSVHGLVVDPSRQGRGLGRTLLRRVCRDLRAEGATAVGLEVAVENARALGLYTSLGFAVVSTEDYWALPLGAGRG